MGGQPIAPLEKRELAIRTTEYDRVALPHIVAIADAAEPLVRRNSPPKTPHSSWEAGRVSPGVPPTPRKRELPVRTTESDRVVQPHVVAIADATEPLVWRNSRPENPHSSWGVPPPLVCARGSGSPPTRAPHAAAASPLELRALLALGTLVRTSWELLFLCVTADVKVDGSFEVTSRFVPH